MGPAAEGHWEAPWDALVRKQETGPELWGQLAARLSRDGGRGHGGSCDMVTSKPTHSDSSPSVEPCPLPHLRAEIQEPPFTSRGARPWSGEDREACEGMGSGLGF